MILPSSCRSLMMLTRTCLPAEVQACAREVTEADQPSIWAARRAFEDPGEGADTRIPTGRDEARGGEGEGGRREGLMRTEVRGRGEGGVRVARSQVRSSLILHPSFLDAAIAHVLSHAMKRHLLLLH